MSVPVDILLDESAQGQYTAPMTYDRFKEWWRLWDNAIIIGTITTLVVSAVIGIGWYVFQTTPSPLTEGRVVTRRFEAAHWEQYMRPVTAYRPSTRTVCSGGYGSVPQTCHTETYMESYTYYVPDQRWVDDDWDLRIDGCSENRRGDTICRTEWIDVSQDVYDNCALSATWREETACRLL